MSFVAGNERAAVVHDWLTGMRGGEKVLEGLLDVLGSAEIFTLFHFPGSVSAKIERHPIHTSALQRAPGLRRHYRRYLPFFPAAIEDFDLGRYDLVLSTSHCVAKGVIPRPGARHFCYCHTPMRYAWDQEHAYFPKRRGAMAFLRRTVLSRLRSWDVASSARVDHFLANSRFVATRIHRYYRRPATVVPPPVDTDFFELGDPEAKKRDLLIVVAALAPYKRIDLAIEAAARLGSRLVVVGDGPDRRRLGRLADRHRADVSFLGHVDAMALRDLYQRAALFVQPGIEDFGIATVEALASGTPVVAASGGGVLDIVEPSEQGLLYDPNGGIDALVETIDKARRLRFNKLNLRARAERFSRHRFQKRIEGILWPEQPGATVLEAE